MLFCKNVKEYQIFRLSQTFGSHCARNLLWLFYCYCLLSHNSFFSFLKFMNIFLLQGLFLSVYNVSLIVYHELWITSTYSYSFYSSVKDQDLTHSSSSSRYMLRIVCSFRNHVVHDWYTKRYLLSYTIHSPIPSGTFLGLNIKHRMQELYITIKLLSIKDNTMTTGVLIALQSTLCTAWCL